MTFMRALRLYGRNASGVFFGGFIDVKNNSGNFLILLVWIGHIALLPLTITLGAFIKTLFDIFSRKEIPTQQFVELKDKINTINDDKIDELASHANEWKNEVQSKSSHKLCEQLMKLDILEQSAIIDGTSKKRQELIIDQLTTEDTPNPQIKYATNFIRTTVLDTAHQEQLNTYIQENKAVCHKQKASLQRQLMSNYLGEDKNAGKYLQHAICNTVFGVDKPKTEVTAAVTDPEMVIKPH